MRHAVAWLGLVLGLSLLADPAAAQRNRKAASALLAQRGEILAQSCFACHGPQGSSSAAAIPSIGGQGGVYLVSALMAFREGKRPASVMDRIARGYTESEILEIAQYLTKQTFRREEQLTDADKVSLGAEAYKRVCIECHLNDGREVEIADYPLLAGQRLLYMQMQMHEIYSTGRRKVDSKFHSMLNKLSREEIDAVLHFFASQR